jgi:hypothetical protein
MHVLLTVGIIVLFFALITAIFLSFAIPSSKNCVFADICASEWSKNLLKIYQRIFSILCLKFSNNEEYSTSIISLIYSHQKCYTLFQ